MKIFLLATLFAFTMLSCGSSETSQPEPHLELGQRISFLGGQPDEVYLITGYRNQLEDKTESQWSNQNYLVFMYRNSQGDFKQGVVHRNTIQKK